MTVEVRGVLQEHLSDLYEHIEDVNDGLVPQDSSLYKPIQHHEIRLLTLAASGYRLNSWPQWLAPDYDTLSYCWGESTETIVISCNGRDFEIRKSPRQP